MEGLGVLLVVVAATSLPLGPVSAVRETSVILASSGQWPMNQVS